MTELAHTEPTEIQAAAAHQAEQAIKATIQQMRSTWVQLAEQLHHFSELQMWRALGYRSFEQWLAGPEIDLSRRTVFYLIESWRELVIKQGVKPEDLQRVEVSKAREILPAVRRGHVDVDTALADAETLSRDDLRERYGHVGRPGGRGVDEPLDAEREPEWAVCQSCGSRYRVRRAA